MQTMIFEIGSELSENDEAVIRKKYIAMYSYGAIAPFYIRPLQVLVFATDMLR